MKKLKLLLAIAIPNLSHGAILAISSFDVTATRQDGSNDIRGDATLNSLTVGSTTYTNFELISSVTGNSTTEYLWAIDGTDPGSYNNALLDSDPVSGGLNVGSSAFFSFGRALAANEVIFILSNSTDSPNIITALDMSGAAIGTRTLTANVGPDLAKADYARSSGIGALDARQVRGVTFTPADFGGTGDISTIYGFSVGNQNYDPNMVGIATVPEPSTGLLALFGLLLFRRRR